MPAGQRLAGGQCGRIGGGSGQHRRVQGGGKQVVTAQSLSAASPGQIRIDGSYWTALPYDDTLVIPAGSTVEVLRIKGATAYVHPVATLES